MGKDISGISEALKKHLFFHSVSDPSTFTFFLREGFRFLPCPGLVPPRLLPSFANVFHPFSLISLEKMLRNQTSQRLQNPLFYGKSRRG